MSISLLGNPYELHDLKYFITILRCANLGAKGAYFRLGPRNKVPLLRP